MSRNVVLPQPLCPQIPILYEDAAPTDSLWILSGSKDDLKRRYKVNSDELQEKEKRLQELEKSLNEQQKALLVQKEKNQRVKQQYERIEAQLNQTLQQNWSSRQHRKCDYSALARKRRQILCFCG